MRAKLHAMFVTTTWFTVVRAVLEVLAFLSTVALAVAGVLALAQIRITRQIAKTNARRESVKLAADLCKYYAETVVPNHDKANIDYKTSALKYLSVFAPAGQGPFILQNGEIVAHFFNVKLLADELPKHSAAVHFLNMLEAFAIPFAAGVADDDIGYRETARPFCQAVLNYMPAIFQLRVQNSGRYESIVKLYETWNTRLAAELAAPAMKAMQQLTESAKARIKPLEDF
jgi:hypothetical protein